MNNRDLPPTCGNCRYRNISIFDYPCNSCRRLFAPGGEMDGWRKRGWWQTPSITYILVAMMIVAVLVVLLMCPIRTH